MTEGFFYALGEPAPDAASANQRFGELWAFLGERVLDAEVDVALEVPDAVRDDVATIRATRRLPWVQKVRVRPSSGDAWAAVPRVAGWTDVVLYDVQRGILGAVHHLAVSAQLTVAEAELLGARLGVDPARVTSPPSGLGALLQRRPQGQ